MIVGRTSLTVDSPSWWSASLFIDNVSNEDGSPAKPPFFPTEDRNMRIRPRTVGVQLECRF
jgi:hypothetical protein